MAVGNKGKHLNPGDRANYVTTCKLFHHHKKIAIYVLRTNFLFDFDRCLVRHPIYPNRAAFRPHLESELPFPYLQYPLHWVQEVHQHS